MTTAPNQPTPVLVDTDVFSWVFVGPRRTPNAQRWADALTGRTLTVVVQTDVELRAWPLWKNWGEKKAQDLDAKLATVGTIQVSLEVQRQFIDLTVWARRHGHAIQDKVHTADRWIAATALAYGLELASGDGIYYGVDGLRRVTTS